MRLRRTWQLLLSLALLALALPMTASAEDFDPSEEFELKEWIPIHIGPLNLSITKAVVYLLLGALITCLIGLGMMRWRLKNSPDRRQTVGELIYDIAQTQVPMRAPAFRP